MRFCPGVLGALTFFCSVNGFASGVSPEVDETVLVGRWQGGLTAQLRRISPEELAKFFTGDVLDFAADHSVRLYPKCGPEKLAWETRGIHYLGGVWRFNPPNKLHIVFEAMGRKLEQDVEFAVSGDDVTFVSPGRPDSQMGKFNGKVPLECRVPTPPKRR